MSKILRVLRFLLAVATVTLCLLLVWQVIDIYQVGNLPENFRSPGIRIAPVWSREIVGARLSALAPVLWGYLALAAAGLVCAAVSPPEREVPPIAPEDSLALLRHRVAEFPAEAAAEGRRRCHIRLSAAGVCGVCTLMAGGYLLRQTNFTSLDLEQVMGQMLLHVVPWVTLGLVAASAAAVLSGRSVRREITILKTVATGPATSMPDKMFPLGILRAALCAVAVGLVILGIRNGGAWDVLVKAINICTECIGLG